MTTETLTLCTKDAEGREIECSFKHPVDFKEALDTGKYYRKGGAVTAAKAPDMLDIDTMTLEDLHRLAQFETLIGWRTMERAELVAALKAKRAPEAPKLAEKAKGK
jgi:hypothetical protein